MNFTVPIPDELAQRLSGNGDLGRQALEALAVEAYRMGRVTKPELRRMLGFNTRYELDGVLKAHEIYENYTAEEIQRQVEDLKSLGY